VSLALRNDPRISEKTRTRIQEIAKEMGYVPDPLLSSLVSYRRRDGCERQAQTLALLFDVEDPNNFDESAYLPSIKNRVVERAEELGYKVDVLRRGVDYRDSAMLNRMLKARGIHGVLFGDVGKDNLTYELDWDAFALVKISQAPLSVPIDSVMGNYFFSVRTAMRKLKELGYQRPAMACSKTEEHNTRNLYRAGFEYGQRKHFAPEHHISALEFERKPVEVLEDEVYQWLKMVKPDVMLSYWNNLHRPALRLTEEGHPCRFVCLEADERSLPLGGIANNFTKTAETAVELLISRMKMNMRGIPQTPNLVLVHEHWHDLGPWPPEARVLERLRIEPGKITRGGAA
jgi:LacI family transcriptional regulator